MILAGLVAPSTKAENYLAIETMNEAFGGLGEVKVLDVGGLRGL